MENSFFLLMRIKWRRTFPLFGIERTHPLFPDRFIFFVEAKCLSFSLEGATLKKWALAYVPSFPFFSVFALLFLPSPEVTNLSLLPPSI